MHFDTALGSEVGVVVRDLEPVLDLYTEGLGLGPFETQEQEWTTATRGDGRAERARVRVASASLGPCELELIEVVDGRPFHADCLDEHGEGMNHLNLDKGSAEAYLATLSNLYWRGIEPFWGLPFGSFCYVDSAPIGGITFEVMVGSGHAGKIGHNHLGLVVGDTQKTIDFYTKTLGLPAFRTGEYPMPRAFYREARIATTFRASFCDLGEAKLRIYQILEGETPMSEHLATRGEGMHHLCLRVPDLQESLQGLAADGVEANWVCPEQHTVFLESKAVGGMTFALAEKSQEPSQ